MSNYEKRDFHKKIYIKSIKTIEHTRPKYSKNLIDSVFNRVSTSPRVKLEQ